MKKIFLFLCIVFNSIWGNNPMQKRDYFSNALWDVAATLIITQVALYLADEISSKKNDTQRQMEKSMGWEKKCIVHRQYIQEHKLRTFFLGLYLIGIMNDWREPKNPNNFFNDKYLWDGLCKRLIWCVGIPKFFQP